MITVTDYGGICFKMQSKAVFLSFDFFHICSGHFISDYTVWCCFFFVLKDLHVHACLYFSLHTCLNSNQSVNWFYWQLYHIPLFYSIFIIPTADSRYKYSDSSVDIGTY